MTSRCTAPRTVPHGAKSPRRDERPTFASLSRRGQLFLLHSLSLRENPSHTPFLCVGVTCVSVNAALTFTGCGLPPERENGVFI